MSFFINIFPEFWLIMKGNFLRKNSEWVLANILWFFLFYIEFLCLRLKKKLLVFPNSWIYKENFFVWNHVDLSWSIFRSCFSTYFKNMEWLFKSNISSFFSITRGLGNHCYIFVLDFIDSFWSSPQK